MTILPLLENKHKGRVAVTVPVYMRSEEDWAITLRTLKGLSETVPVDQTILVVDDCSPYKEGVAELREFLPLVPQYWSLYLKPKNSGFANSVNVGLRMARENKMHCLLVNADMEFPEPRWFHHLIATNGSVVGGKLLYPTGLIQHAGVYFSIVTRTFDHLHKFAPADLKAANFKRKCPVTGALQLIKHDCIEAVGFYDESFKMGWEDVDYCLRVFYAGRYCIYNPDVVVIHHESVFRGNRDDRITDWTIESFHHLYAKHAGKSFAEYVPMLIGQDPMHDPLAKDYP